MTPISQVYEDAPAFIPIPAAYQHHRIQVTIVTLDEVNETPPPKKRRSPPEKFVGKARDLGDVMSTVPAADWGMPE